MANLNTTDAEITLVGAYAIGNAPPSDVAVAAVTNTNYLYATQNPSGSASCAVGKPYMQCGDIYNKVAMNRTGYEDSEADMINFYAQYDLTENMSIKYTYADNSVHQYVFRDGDYTTESVVPAMPMIRRLTVAWTISIGLTSCPMTTMRPLMSCY